MPNDLDPVSELALIENALDRRAWTDEVCASTLAGVTEDFATHAPVQELSAALGPLVANDAVERAVLLRAARYGKDRIDALRVVPEVQLLLRKELAAFAAHRKAFPVSAGTYNFVIASKMATLRRFPCGPMDWEVSGVPLSWAADLSNRDRLRFLSHTATAMRGRRPLFFMHVAPAPRSRALVLEKEVMRGWHRMASSLQLQPEMKGIAASAWFLDPKALEAQPHLRWLNAPFREWGGIIGTAGEAPADSGVLERNKERARQVLAGEVRYRIGRGLWSRSAALQWAGRHTELST
jgi:hypothetical protein